MRPVQRKHSCFRASLCAVVIAVGAAVPAFAAEPDDVPWDDIDRVLKENPSNSETPAAPSGPSAAQVTAETNSVTTSTPPTSATPVDPSKVDPSKVVTARAEDTNQNLGDQTDPQATAPVAAPVPGGAPTAAPASSPDPNAGTSPNGGSPGAAPDTAATPSVPPPVTPDAQTARAPDPSVAPLYLPLGNYFEQRAAVMLRDFDQADRDALQKFYTARMNQSIWTTREGFNAAANNLIAELKAADDWGLSSADYKIPNLIKIGGGEFRDEDLADAEIKLSLVAMQYAHHARGGRIPEPSTQLSSYLDRKPQVIDHSKFFENLASSAPLAGDYLRTLHPKHEQFERLRQKLIALRKNSAQEEFEKIPDGPKLTPGKAHWQIALVRRRLKGEAAKKPDGTVAEDGFYDDALARMVEDFKRKNDIEPVNPAITTALRKALNVDNRVSENTILANMEQWRWMPEDLGATHILVNIPEYLVRVIKNNGILHEERVVTGKIETQTPIFSDKMRTVVFQPPWNVPESIKVNELLPGLRGGGNPLEKQGLTIERNGRKLSAWDIDWDTADIRQYHIYQAPGDANVLGVVKFLFPNKHSVYLHDSPAKKLFNEKVRTFSHGCMRVRNPVRLAEVIMNEDKGWDKDRVNELVTSGPEDNNITLDKPMPVHVTYFTAWVNDNGDIKTFGDAYGHEKRIVLGLEGRWNDIDKNRDHLLPADPDDVVARTVSTRDDNWDQDRAYRRASRPRYTYREPPPPPGYKQPQQKKGNLKGSAFGEFLNNMFGNF